MKIAILTIVALLTVNTAILAADDEDTHIRVRKVKSSEKEAFIRVTNISGQTSATLRIKDKRGVTLHREEIRDQSYMKKYDFSHLPNGKYTIEVRTKNGVSKEVFQITSGQRNMLYFKPGVQLTPDMVKVAFMNKVDSPVFVRLYNRFGKVLYEEKVASQEIYSKGLNVSRLLRGNYSLAIVGDHYIYTKSLDLY
ncbi:hypothetical protein [Catalinimonas niigatensis]|uniref:hypothetical protein n=1 Tax=Catalinimonas niigatensis TaxID=1397264 RepID=UPI002666E184|nr:hypothetical protein [Catalinimonas niigatensis]WPP52394.1 hypothetical protein PZB72_08365 [Catalinimonas niigatensis]